MPRGGRRPGAGAPKGNLNALKTGQYSKQFAQVGALLANDPKVREALLGIARKYGVRRQKSTEIAALLLTRLYKRAEQRAGPNGLNLGLAVDDRDSIIRTLGSGAQSAIQKAHEGQGNTENSHGIDQTQAQPPGVNQTP